MNLDEYLWIISVNHHLLQAITLQPTCENVKNKIFYSFITSNYQSISQNLKVVGLIGGKCDFFILLGIHIELGFITPTQELTSTHSEL